MKEWSKDFLKEEASFCKEELDNKVVGAVIC